MGYYTYYTLKIKDSIIDSSYVINELREENEDAKYALDNEGYSQDEAKWYNAEEDIREFSKKYPEVLFILEGQGEESDDVWRTYIQNGKSHSVSGVIKFKAFNKKLLK